MKLAPHKIVALLVFVIAFVLLAGSTSSIPHPGQSTLLLTQKLGVDPLGYFANPVYGWIIKGIYTVSGDAAIFMINLFSGFCGALLLSLLFLLIYRTSRSYNKEKIFSPPQMHRIQLAAAAIAVLYVLVATPFFMAATRANPLMFDLLLLLGAFYMVYASVRENALSRMMLASLLYGIAIVEFNTAILLFPVFVCLLFYKLWTCEVFSLRSIIKLALFGLLGLSLYAIQAGFYMASPAFELRSFTGYFQIFYYIWQEQYQLLTLTLPRVGWLTMGMVSVLPWLLSIWLGFTSGAARNRAAQIGSLMLYSLLGVLAVLLLLDFPLAPVSLTGTSRLFVTPYLWIGLWVGNVIAFWLVVLFREKRFDSDAMRSMRRAIGIVIVVAAPLYLIAMLMTATLPKANNPADHLVQEFVSQVIDTAADKEWLVTATPLDEQFALEAFLRRLPLKLLRLSYARSPVHMKYLARQFPDNPRLESLARIGMEPLLEEWFLRTPDVENKIIVVHLPDMWLNAGMEAVPNLTVFMGAKPDAPKDLDRLLAEHQVYWDDFGVRLINAGVAKSGPGVLLAWMRIHLSKVANNLGVYLEDNGRMDDAFRCYEKARELEPDNLSALMNMHVMAQREGRPELATLEEELIKRTENIMGKVQALSLSFVYGFVRVPELFARRGMAFAMSGKPSMAITEMKKALDLRENNPQLQMALANLYFAQDKDIESSEYYQNVLNNNPENLDAIRGLMRLAMRQGEAGEARRLLADLKKKGVDPQILKLDEAVLESVAGAPEKAIRLLKDVVKENPGNMSAWAALALTSAQVNDLKTSELAMEKLREAQVLTPTIQLVLAQAALDQKDRDGARRYISDILRRQPGNIKALEMLLRIELSEGNRDSVQKMVEQILRYESHNALANYMLGVHHYYKEEYALAEASYRASLATTRSAEALNDLAYVLTTQGRVEEAEPLVREALSLNGRNSSSWDTLGVILMKQNRLEESEEAFRSSLALRPNAAVVILNLALLYEKQQRWEETSRLADDAASRINELSSIDQNKLRQLQQRLLDRR